MYFFITFAILILSNNAQVVYPLPAPIPIPYGNLPTGNAVRERVDGVRYICFGCTEGIGFQTALKYKSRGAHVLITGTKTKGKYPSSLINQFDDYKQMEFGRQNSVKRFLDDYYDEYGTRPDAYGVFGTKYQQGSTRYIVPIAEYLLKMYIADPLELHYGLMNNNGQSTNRTMNITIAGSAAGIAGNQFLQVYGIGKTFWERWVEDFPQYEGRGIYPLVKVSIVMCAYAKTNIVVNSINPGRDLGDDFDKDLHDLIVYANAINGNDPAFIADAHYEIGTDKAIGGSRMAMVPTSIPQGRAGSDFLFSIRVRDDSPAFTQHMDFAYQQLQFNTSKYIERRNQERIQGTLLSL